MADQRVQRRLAAILAADVVGFSRLMEADEAGTLAALKARRAKILDPLVAEFGGRIVKVMGDGVLVEFASAVNAVQCAIEMQRETGAANAALPEAGRIALRIGVNLGDVIVEGGDLYGDGVNVAARLEALAAPEEIYISGSVHDQVRGKLDVALADLGERSLKNLSQPVRVYRATASGSGSRNTVVETPLPLPQKPSIAVLPFVNMSGEADQEVFADGLTEDLITDLSRSAGLFVIARNSTFAYKGRSLDVRAIARDLGVRYVLEGSARRAAGRVRINVQLIDAIDGNHLWAERFDRELDDIFAVQDEVTARIVSALVGRLTSMPERNRPRNMEAYDLCVRGRGLISYAAGTPEAVREGAILLRQAIEIDPDYAEAHRWLAFNYWESWAHGIDPTASHRTASIEHARRAVALDPNDAGNRWVLGYLLSYEREWEESDSEFAAAFTLDPNHANAFMMRAELEVFAGRPHAGVELCARAWRLNPHPFSWYYWVHGLVLYACRDYDGCVKALTVEATYRTGSRRVLAAGLAQLGRMDDARREASLFVSNNPHFRSSIWAATQPARDRASVDHFVEGYRKAGLPD